VLSQIWVALTSMSQVLRLLHLNLFARRSFGELLRPPPPDRQDYGQQLSLAIG
jgi:hypothetical protein